MLNIKKEFYSFQRISSCQFLILITWSKYSGPIFGDQEVKHFLEGSESHPKTGESPAKLIFHCRVFRTRIPEFMVHKK